MYFIFYDFVNALMHTVSRGVCSNRCVPVGKPNKNIRRDKIRRQHKESTEKIGKKHWATIHNGKHISKLYKTIANNCIREFHN